MRDEETGTSWQQVTGAAIAGPLRGARLELVPMDELSFGLWRQESPAGSVDDRRGRRPDRWPAAPSTRQPLEFPELLHYLNDSGQVPQNYSLPKALLLR